jgi:hypothetical protein
MILLKENNDYLENDIVHSSKISGNYYKKSPLRYAITSSPSSRKLVAKMVGPAPPEPAVK